MNRWYNTLFSVLGGIAAVVGIVFWFVPSLPNTVTYICAGICILDNVVQVFFGNQNNFATEIYAVIIAAIICVIWKRPLLPMAALCLCFESALMTVLAPLVMMILVNFP